MDITKNVSLSSPTSAHATTVRYNPHYRYASGPSGPAIEILIGISWSVFSLNSTDPVTVFKHNDDDEVWIGQLDLWPNGRDYCDSLGNVNFEILQEFMRSVASELGVDFVS